MTEKKETLMETKIEVDIDRGCFLKACSFMADNLREEGRSLKEIHDSLTYYVGVACKSLVQTGRMNDTKKYPLFLEGSEHSKEDYDNLKKKLFEKHDYDGLTNLLFREE